MNQMINKITRKSTTMPKVIPAIALVESGLVVSGFKLIAVGIAGSVVVLAIASKPLQSRFPQPCLMYKTEILV